MKTNIYRFLDCSDDGRTILKCDTNFTGDLILPEGIERIADYAFEWCDGLESITFPKSLVSIGENAFAGCEYLKEISFEEGVKIIGDFCFQNCHSLSEVVLPDSLEIIADYAFSDCYSLKKIVLPSHLKRLGRGAFSDCNNLESIRLPKTIENIEDYTFQGCQSIVVFCMPKSIKTIGGHAFEGCKKMNLIQMSELLTSIGDRAFGCCHSLSTITVPKSVKIMGDGVFDGCTSLKTIIFEGAVEKFGKIEGWMEPGNFNAIYYDYLYGYELYDGIREYGIDFDIGLEQEMQYIEDEHQRWNELNILIPLGKQGNYARLFQHYLEIKELNDDSKEANPTKMKYGTDISVDVFLRPRYYEEGTSYARQINKLRSHSFSDIRDISVRFIHEFDNEEIDELFEEINHGMDVLSTNEHLHIYMYCFGLMHEAKLNKAFLEIPKRFFKPSEIEIVDYACGQGIASLCFANFLENSVHETRIKNITLIEPSTVALSRAALICHKVCPEAIIETIASEFDDLEDDQISTTEVPRVHLLSNILDMTCYDLNHLARVINQVKKKGDLFVCVDPWYHDRKLDGRQRKLMRLLNGKEIYHDVFNAYQLQEDKSWTAYITIFRV